MRKICTVALSLILSWRPEVAAQVPAEHVAQHVKTMRGGNKEARAAACIALGNFGLAAADAVPALAEAMRRDSDANVANHASRALARIGRPALPELIRAVADADYHVRYRAVWALHCFGPEAVAAVPALTHVLSDDHEGCRSWAAYALGEIGPEAKDAAGSLVKLLRDPKAAVRQQAATALRKIGPRVVPELTGALRDRQDKVREDAAYALRLLGPDARLAAPDLAEAVNDKNARVRIQALAALAAIGKDAKEAIPAVLEALQVKHYDTQVQALRTILILGADDGPELAERLRDINNKTAWAVPYVLAQFGPRTRDAVPHLMRMLREPDEQSRYRAALALAQIGPEAKQAVPMLERAAKDPSPQVKTAASVALASLDKVRHKEAMDALDVAQLRAERALAAAALQARLVEQVMRLVPHESPLALRMLLGPVNRAALTDVTLQSQYDEVLSTFVSSMGVGPNQAGVCSPHSQVQKASQALVKQMSAEAVPALVRASNFALSYNIGFS